MASGACISGSIARPGDATRRGCGGAATTSTTKAERLFQSRGPELSVDLLPQLHDELRQELDVRQRRPEIHDAGAEQIAIANVRVGYERLAAQSQRGRNPRIQLVQIIRNCSRFHRALPQIRRNESESADT